jgi:hypothetical protein
MYLSANIWSLGAVLRVGKLLWEEYSIKKRGKGFTWLQNFLIFMTHFTRTDYYME